MNNYERYAAQSGPALPMSSRGKWIVVALASILALFVALSVTSSARADINPEGPSSSTGGVIDDATLGGHPDYRIIARSDRDTDTESITRVAGDFPVGMLANPNAIPWADRCPMDVFHASGFQEGARCPVSSRIGSGRFRVRMDISPLGNPANPLAWFKLGLNSDNPVCIPESMTNFQSCSPALYLLQGDPEVPATVGTIIEPTPGFIRPVRVTAEVRPVTKGPDGDLRLRFVTNPIPNYIYMVNNPTGSPTPRRPLVLEDFEMVLWGQLPKGTEDMKPKECDFEVEPECDPAEMVLNPECPRGNAAYTGMGMAFVFRQCRTGAYFLTNPTSPGPWKTRVYLRAHDSNTNADTDITGNGNEFVKMPDIDMASDNSSPAQLTSAAGAEFSRTARDASPSLDVVIGNPGYGTTTGRGVDVPKTITAVLPDAVNVDVNEIGRLCEPAAFDARKCPDSSIVGNVWINTPLLGNGLRGEAVLVRKTSGDGRLPRLGLIIHGAVNFNVLSDTRYVGNGTQIETRFDNIPQIGFESLRLRINGGTNGLLRIDRCQPGGSDLKDGGPTQFTITGYGGQTKAISSAAFAPENCFSRKVSVKSPKKCVKKSFTVRPTIASSKEVSKVTLSSKRSKTVTDKKSPFKPKLKVGKKVKKGKKTKFKVRVFYKAQDGKKVKSVTKSGKFTRCR